MWYDGRWVYDVHDWAIQSSNWTSYKWKVCEAKDDRILHWCTDVYQPLWGKRSWEEIGGRSIVSKFKELQTYTVHIFGGVKYINLKSSTLGEFLCSSTHFAVIMICTTWKKIRLHKWWETKARKTNGGVVQNYFSGELFKWQDILCVRPLRNIARGEEDFVNYETSYQFFLIINLDRHSY